MDPTTGCSPAVPTATSPSRGYVLSGKIMLSVIVTLFFIVIFILFLHLYVRWNVLRRYDRRRRRNLLMLTSAEHRTARPAGLDKEILSSLAVEIFRGDDDAAEADCAVCLNGFDGGEKLRVLPRCGHRFHVDCIDMWFSSHSTCPLCRSAVEAVTSPAPEESDPVTTPESEASDSDPRNREVRIEIREESESSGAGAPVKLPIYTRISSIRKFFIGERGGSTNRTSPPPPPPPPPPITQ